MKFQKTHGHNQKSSRVYRAWCAMRRRCNNPNAVQFKYYGGRGIHVCEQWNSFEQFLADMGEPPDGFTLDRIDTDGPYSAGNCRWADGVMQRRNRRCVKLSPDIAKTIKKRLAEGARLCDLAREHGVTSEAIGRIRNGLLYKEA